MPDYDAPFGNEDYQFLPPREQDVDEDYPDEDEDDGEDWDDDDDEDVTNAD